MDFKTILKEIKKEAEDQIKELKLDVKADGDRFDFEVIANMQTPDRVGETIVVDGYDLENYKKNPILLFGHDYYSIQNIIGKVINIEKVEIDWIPALKASWVFASTENARVAKQLYDEGVLKTVSIGFKVLERAEDNPNMITKSELLEISFVPVPCHQDALSTMEKSVVEKAFAVGLLEKKEDTNNNEEVTLEKRLDNIEAMLKYISSNLLEMKAFMGEVKDEKNNDSEINKTLEKIATIANTSLKKHFKS